MTPTATSATGYTGTVALSSSDGHAVLPADYTFTAADAGTHSFSVTLETAGTQSITATDTVAPSLTASETGITVQAAAAKTLDGDRLPDDRHGRRGRSASPSPPTMPTATWRPATRARWPFTSSDGHAVLPAATRSRAGDAGTHTFSVTLETAGTQSITATDTTTPSITGREPNIVVQAAAAKTLVVTGFPTTDTAGAADQVTVTAYDAYGNVATGYTGTVALSSSDGHAVLPARLHLQRRRRGHAQLFGHARNRRVAVDHGQ